MTPFVSVIAIGGVDPTGGAGLARDALFLGRLGVHAATVVTALTVQDDQGVRAVDPVDDDFLARQIDAALAALGPTVRAFKTGLIATPSQARIVVDAAARMALPIICDPVLAAGTGDPLHAGSPAAALRPLALAARLITPNRDEAEKLTGQKWDGTDEGLLTLARALAGRNRFAAVTLGAGDGPEVAMALAGPGHARIVRAPRRPGVTTHGTGCAFAAAAAGSIAQGVSPPDAAARAHRLVSGAISEALGPPGRLVPAP